MSTHRASSPIQNENETFRHQMGVFRKCSTEFSEFSDKNICHYNKKRLEPVTFCVRDQDASTAPARHVRDRIS